MITVEMPDGTTLQFPDGTPQDVMKDAIRRRFGPSRAEVQATNMAAPPTSSMPALANMEGALSSTDPAAAGVMAAFGAQPDTGMAAELSDLSRGDFSTPHQMARAGFQGLTFGAGDEITARASAAIDGLDYGSELDRERGMLDTFREESPLAAYGSEIAGAMAVPVGAVAKGGGLGMRAILSALSGAGQGAAYGFNTGEGGLENRIQNMAVPAAIGGVIGGAIPVAGQMFRNIGNARNQTAQARAIARNAPTTEALRAQGQAAYQAIDDAGVQIRPEAFSQTMDDILAGLRQEGLSEIPGNALNPKTANVVQAGQQMAAQMADNPTAALPFSSLDQLRRQAGNAAADVTLMGRATPDARLGSQVVAGIDDFVENLTPEQVTSGDLNTLQEMIPKAREIWARMSRSQMLDDAIDNSQNYLAGDASGLRNQFARILRNPRLSRGFDDAEKAMMRRVINGTIPERLLHLAGGGLGNLATIGIGSTGGPVGMLIGTGIAAGARKASDAVANRNAEIARALVAAGGLRGNPAPQISDQTVRIVEQLLGIAGRAPVSMAAQ